jgi:hypothetical protein
MRLLKFSERFNLEIDAQEAKRRFMLRMNTTFWQSDFYKKELRHHQDVLAQKAATAMLEPYRFFTTPQSYIGDDFYRCLQIVEVIVQHFQELNDRDRVHKIEAIIKEVLAHDTIGVAIVWKDGRFFPTSPDVLDRSLIEETLTWLAIMDSQPLMDTYSNAIRYFIMPEAGKDHRADLQNALEQSVKLFLKQLSNAVPQDVIAALTTWMSRFPEQSYGRLITAQLIDVYKHAQRASSLTRADQESLLFATGAFFRWNIESVYRRSL